MQVNAIIVAGSIVSKSLSCNSFQVIFMNVDVASFF